MGGTPLCAEVPNIGGYTELDPSSIQSLLTLTRERGYNPAQSSPLTLTPLGPWASLTSPTQGLLPS